MINQLVFVIEKTKFNKFAFYYHKNNFEWFFKKTQKENFLELNNTYVKRGNTAKLIDLSYSFICCSFFFFLQCKA